MSERDVLTRRLEVCLSDDPGRRDVGRGPGSRMCFYRYPFSRYGPVKYQGTTTGGRLYEGEKRGLTEGSDPRSSHLSRRGRGGDDSDEIVPFRSGPPRPGWFVDDGGPSGSDLHEGVGPTRSFSESQGSSVDSCKT